MACIFLSHVVSFTTGPRNLSAAVLSSTSVYLTWVAPCHTQQYHIYYRGTCRTYVDEGRLDTDRQEHTLHGLQRGTNYSFTVTQSGFSGGRVLSTGPVYARTFTTGEEHCDKCIFSKQLYACMVTNELPNQSSKNRFVARLITQ